MKDKNRSLIKEYVMKWNLHDIKRACQVNGFPAFFGIVMLLDCFQAGYREQMKRYSSMIF